MRETNSKSKENDELYTFKSYIKGKCLVQFVVLFKSLCGTNGTFLFEASTKNFDEVATLFLNRLGVGKNRRNQFSS